MTAIQDHTTTTTQVTPLPEVPTRAAQMSPVEAVGGHHREVPVTEDHIRRAIRGSETHCPIALAMKDAGLMDPHVVGPRGSLAGVDGQRFPAPVTCAFDLGAIDMVRRFDAGEPVEPVVLIFSTPVV